MANKDKAPGHAGIKEAPLTDSILVAGPNFMKD